MNNIENLELSITRMINKENGIYFLVYDTKSNPRAAIKNIYDMALALKENGYSPRLLVETLVRDRPLVINSAIYGGWKYINDRNGRFFNAPTIQEYMDFGYNSDHVESLTTAIQDVLKLDNKVIIKDFYKVWGFKNSVIRLADIIYDVSGKRYKAVAFKEWKSALKKTARFEKWI